MQIQKQFENLRRELRDSILLVLRDYSEALLLAILMALVLRFFVFSAYKIVNPTMEPSLKLGDFVIAYKLPYGFQVPFSQIRLGHGTPRRGDTVVFRCPKDQGQSCVKRVVGVAGDRIEIKGKRLYINNKRAEYEPGQEQMSPQILSNNKLVSLKETFSDRSASILVSDRKGDEEFGPYVVPPDHFFALGDNRDFSEDSRHWGGVPYRFIEAKAVMVWLSIEWRPTPDGGFDSRVRWDRFFRSVH